MFLHPKNPSGDQTLGQSVLKFCSKIQWNFQQIYILMQGITALNPQIYVEVQFSHWSFIKAFDGTTCRFHDTNTLLKNKDTGFFHQLKRISPQWRSLTHSESLCLSAEPISMQWFTVLNQFPHSVSLRRNVKFPYTYLFKCSK